MPLAPSMSEGLTRRDFYCFLGGCLTVLMFSSKSSESSWSASVRCVTSIISVAVLFGNYEPGFARPPSTATKSATAYRSQLPMRCVFCWLELCTLGDCSCDYCVHSGCCGESWD